MIKFVIPAIIVFLIVLFWEKVNNYIYKKFQIKINYLAFTFFFVVIGIIFALLYY